MSKLFRRRPVHPSPRPRSHGLALALSVSLWLVMVAASDPARAALLRQADPYATVDACIEAEMRAVGAAGASVAIARDGNIAYAKGYGVKHRENGGVVDTETLFRIGSTTKMMTAAALMTLADAGQLDLHAPITDPLHELQLPAPWDAAAITPHHLLSHTSGMSESYRLHRYELFNQVSLDEWATEYLPRTPMAAPPGSVWNYSNPGFSLAGHLLERVSGQSYADYTAEQVWRPAGMPRTTFSTEAVEADGNFAWGHDGGRRLSPGDLPAAVLGPAGMAFSTPTELATWALTLAEGGGEVLSPASAAAMQSPHATTDWSPFTDYGYGIFVTSFQDRDDPEQLVTVYDHAGNTTGWGSELAWVPERGVAISILDNTAASLGDSLHCALREVANLVPRSAAGLGTPPGSWDAFVGTYAELNQALWDSTLRITRDGDRLLLQRLEAGTVTPLVNLFHNTFAIDADGNGRPDSTAVTRRYTFGGQRPGERPIRWMHNRIQVSERVGQFPESITLEGSGCTPFAFTSEIDIPDPRLTASGLVPPGAERLLDLPLMQDDPSDPSTAGYKQDLTVRGEAGLLVLRIDLQSGDDAGLYLMGDTDADGRFDYPSELVDVGWEGQGYRVLTVNRRLPAGRYQVWVHGIAVRGSGRSFDLETQLVHGTLLRISKAPPLAQAGQALTAEVCAEGVEELTEPMRGLLEFDYGSPPRRIRIPVEWAPGEPPDVEDPQIYIPWISHR